MDSTLVVALLHGWTHSMRVLISLHDCRRHWLSLVVVRGTLDYHSGASLSLSSLTHLLRCGNLVPKARCGAAPLWERLADIRSFGLMPPATYWQAAARPGRACGSFRPRARERRLPRGASFRSPDALATSGQRASSWHGRANTTSWLRDANALPRT